MLLLNATKPNATEPNATETNAAKSNATETNAIEPNATETNATKPNASKPNATDQQNQKQKEEREGGAALHSNSNSGSVQDGKKIEVTPCDPGIKGNELETKQKYLVPKEIFVPLKIPFNPLYFLSLSIGSTMSDC